MDPLIARLTAANEAYRNGGRLLMTDEEYDAGLEALAKKVPNHPLLTTLRAKPVAGKAVPMPFYLGSLDKAKAPEDLDKWVKRQKADHGGYVLSEKLDGISGLWSPSKGRLYLSGDDNMGVDVSDWLRYISLGPKDIHLTEIPESMWIRGELIMPRHKIPEGRLGRSIVNGIFHRDIPDPVESAKVRFVSYECINHPTPLSVSQQFMWLNTWGLWIPWVSSVVALDASNLTDTLALRRVKSDYDMDGLVICLNYPMLRVSKGNPKDAIAWKPPTGDTRLTKVVAVEWNASANGRLVPRVQIEPVALGGSTIQFVTGTHARRVVDWGVGPGAMVILRKGGDVIPVLDKVEVPAQVVFPPEGTWEWEGPADTAIHIRQTKADTTTASAQLMRVATKLGWDGVGPSQMEKVVEAGYTTISQLRAVSLAEFQKLLGAVKGAKFHALVQGEGWKSADETDLYVASPVSKTGIGQTRLKVLLEVEPDMTKWLNWSKPAPKGWSPESLKEFLENWRIYVEFRRKEWNFLAFPSVPQPLQGPAVPTPQSTIPQKGTVVFSGVRNAEVEEKLAAKGYKTVDTVKADCKAVLIADSKDVASYSSGKTEKAKKIPGCRILRCADWALL